MFRLAEPNIHRAGSNILHMSSMMNRGLLLTSLHSLPKCCRAELKWHRCLCAPGVALSLCMAEWSRNYYCLSAMQTAARNSKITDKMLTGDL